MVKNYTEPTNKAVWARYKPLVRLLFICSILASAYSGVTEYYNFFSSSSIPNHSMRVFSALALTLLIELSFRGFSKMLFETIFEGGIQDENLENEGESDSTDDTERGRPVMIAFFIIALLLIGYVTVDNSLDGKNIYIEDTTPPPDSTKHDNTHSNSLKKEATLQFEADSIRVLDSIKRVFVKKKQELGTKKEKAQNSINWLKEIGEYSYTRAASHIKKRDNAKDDLKELPKEENSAFDLAILPYIANYKEMLKLAEDTLQYARGIAITATNEDYEKYLKHKADKQSSYGFLVFVAIALILVYNFFKYYSFKASGRKPTYILNPIGSSVSPIDKLKEGIKVKSYNAFNWLVDLIVGSAIEVNDTGIELKKKPQQKVNDETVLDGDMMDENNPSPIPKLEDDKLSEEDKKFLARKAREEDKHFHTFKPRSEFSSDEEFNAQHSREWCESKGIDYDLLRAKTLAEYQSFVQKSTPPSGTPSGLPSVPPSSSQSDGKSDGDNTKPDGKPNDKQEKPPLPSEFQIDIILSSKFLQGVRNHYWASKGLNGRGAKQKTREKNERLYNQKKQILESFGVQVIEKPETVNFDITAVKRI